MASIITSDGVRLDYTESGDPTGMPVVLIAGFRAAATSWLYQVPALVEAGYRVFALDTRGHGASEKPAFGHSMHRRGTDLEDFLAALDLRGVALVGGSMGGNTIWAYLEQFGTTRISAVVIVDQTPKMLNTGDWPFGFYGYDQSTVDTMFATGVPSTGTAHLSFGAGCDSSDCCGRCRVDRRWRGRSTRASSSCSETTLARTGDR